MTYKQPGGSTNEAMYKIIGGDKKEYGPVSADELRRWIAEGRLNGQSLALAEGSAEWRPLSSFPEFAEALRGQAGASVPPPGVPMPPVSAEIWTAQILAQQPQIQVGRCLALVRVQVLAGVPVDVEKAEDARRYKNARQGGNQCPALELDAANGQVGCCTWPCAACSTAGCI